MNANNLLEAPSFRVGSPQFTIDEEQLEGMEEKTRTWRHEVSMVVRSHPYQSEQCPHWKCTDNLKSDFRDQVTGRWMCFKELNFGLPEGYCVVAEIKLRKRAGEP